MKDCEIVERAPTPGELVELRRLVGWRYLVRRPNEHFGHGMMQFRKQK